MWNQCAGGFLKFIIRTSICRSLIKSCIYTFLKTLMHISNFWYMDEIDAQIELRNGINGSSIYGS